MLGARLLLGALLLGIGLAPMPAQAAGGLEFLDNRPVVVDLDQVEAGQQWRVQVLNLAGGDQNVSLHVVFEPVDVVTVAQSPRTFDGDVVEFVIELQRRVAGSGELVAVSGSQVARRELQTQFGTFGSELTVGSLQFAGDRIAPFTTLVRIPPIGVPGDTGRAESSLPQRIGLLTSARGDIAEVVRVGDEFVVHGVGTVGEFTGSFDLGRGGPPVEATVRVRDLAIWPLLALLAGLTVAHTLDRYQRRHRPQKLHERRLAALQNRAREAESQTGGTLRISAPPGEPDGYLLDQLFADARAAFHALMSDSERALWEPGGAEYEKLTGAVTQFRELSAAVRSLQQERDRLVRSADRAEQDRMREALDRSPVGHALRERSIRSPADLTDADGPVRDGRSYLDRFEVIYDRLAKLRRRASATFRPDVEEAMTELFHAGAELAVAEASSRELEHRWEHSVVEALPPPVPAGATASPWRRGTESASSGESAPRAKKSRRTVPAVLAAVAAVAVAAVVVSVFIAPAYLPSPENGQAQPGPTLPDSENGDSGRSMARVRHLPLHHRQLRRSRMRPSPAPPNRLSRLGWSCAHRRRARRCGSASSSRRYSSRLRSPPAGWPLTGDGTVLAAVRTASIRRRSSERSAGRISASPFWPALSWY